MNRIFSVRRDLQQSSSPKLMTLGTGGIRRSWVPILRNCLHPLAAWDAKELHISRASRLLLLFFLPGGLTESWQPWSLRAGILCSQFLGSLPKEICRGASSLGALQSLRLSWSNNFFQTPTLCQPARSTVEEQGRGTGRKSGVIPAASSKSNFPCKMFLTTFSNPLCKP